MRKERPEAVIYEGSHVSEALAAARHAAMMQNFLTSTYNYPAHAFEGITVTTDAVITTLGDFDPNAPEIDDDIKALVERAHIFELPIAFISDHLKGRQLVRADLGDIWVPYEHSHAVDLELFPWLGNIAAKVSTQE